jgi:uncharacterized paraquat-inducible protein A
MPFSLDDRRRKDVGCRFASVLIGMVADLWSPGSYDLLVCLFTASNLVTFVFVLVVVVLVLSSTSVHALG